MSKRPVVVVPNFKNLKNVFDHLDRLGKELDASLKAWSIPIGESLSSVGDALPVFVNEAEESAEAQAITPPAMASAVPPEPQLLIIDAPPKTRSALKTERYDRINRVSRAYRDLHGKRLTDRMLAGLASETWTERSFISWYKSCHKKLTLGHVALIEKALSKLEFELGLK